MRSAAAGRAGSRTPDTGKYRMIADRWHVGFTDLTGDQGLLGQVEGRVSTVVAAWLKAQPAARRGAITHVAIDMCAIFRSAIRAALPHGFRNPVN
ncbi:transposase [Nonomuraea turcica]|uniref:transposase n=1 Tax=Nonomuraea sp. G32 TaxID=3067274 RepID=UPI00273AEE00|nr:transposase [Nonomuraea sp. G32]MDP4510632.1 transposase [Nonomuraea sp. G32]